MSFINTAKEVQPQHSYLPKLPKLLGQVCGYYRYDAPSPYLYTWSRLLQSVVSVAATKMLTDVWHDKHHAIYKCEGGCNIPGVGELVLINDHCYWDYDRREHSKSEKQRQKCADLITAIVLKWDPEDPVDSMLAVASEHIGEDLQELRTAIEVGSSGASPFGGDSLSSFFDHNPFGKFKVDRKYLRFCYTRFNDMTPKQVTQLFKDEDLSDKLLKKLNEARVENYFYCCSPKRDDNGLRFWLNGSALYGWFTKEQVAEITQKIKRGESIEEYKSS